MKAIDKTGRFLSSVVYQNITVLLGIGIFRILFSPAGWFSNPELFKIVDPFMIYLIPLLFAYTGGRLIGDHRGGVTGAFVTLGLIIGSDQEYPMILPALVIGPLIGWFIRGTDKWLENRIPTGFEFLISNVVSAVIGTCFALVSYLYLVPLTTFFIQLILRGTEYLIGLGILPLIALLIEPGKMLFFNNVINHGILEPLGMNQLQRAHASVFFLLESNPGPGFGMLLANYLMKNQKSARDELKTAMTIEMLGGIHEVYFPYALMKPILIIPLVMGGLIGDFIFYSQGTGLVATPSPGSLLVILTLTPKGGYTAVLFGIAASAAVSFYASYIMLRLNKSEKGTPANVMTTQSEIDAPSPNNEKEGDVQKSIEKVVFACEGGMASSSMGAARLRKLLKQEELSHIQVVYTPIDRIPEDADLVVIHQQLKSRTIKRAPAAHYLFVPSLIVPEMYQQIVELIRPLREPDQVNDKDLDQEVQPFFRAEHVLLNRKAEDKWEAIQILGNHLVALGKVKKSYIREMEQRESLQSTYIGNGIAIPHGLDAESDAILQEGIVMVRFTEGVPFGDDKMAYLLVGICGKGEDHLGLISKLANLLDHPQYREVLMELQSKEQIAAFVDGLLMKQDGKRE